jgi:peptide subunit release factor 1 (eRF1)
LFHAIDVHRLAELHGPERAFVSLYLSDRRDGAGWLDHRAGRIREMLTEQPDELAHFDEGLRMLRAWLEEDAPREGPLCAFVCYALDMVEGYPLSVAPPNVMRVSSSPYLRPLLELRDEFETFLVVAADATATRILLLASARPEREERVRGDVKNRVKKGGWSQKRYARRRQNELLHYAAEVADTVAAVADERQLGRIVLLGAAETTRAIEEALRTDLADRVVGRKGAALDQGDEALLEEAFGLFFEAERKEERDTWEAIRDQVLSDGLGASGATDVLAAALVGRVDTLLVTRDARIAGTRCRDCDNVVHGTPSTCQICGSRSVFQADLVNEVARQVEKHGGAVDFSDPIPGLSKAGDIAALLRW